MLAPRREGVVKELAQCRRLPWLWGDVVELILYWFLTKQRQNLQKFDTIITYDRAEDESPSLFTKLHVHFEFEGQLAPDKVRHAVDLSINKYCSVAKIIEKTAPITVSWTINGDHYSLDSSN